MSIRTYGLLYLDLKDSELVAKTDENTKIVLATHHLASYFLPNEILPSVIKNFRNVHCTYVREVETIIILVYLDWNDDNLE